MDKGSGKKTVKQDTFHRRLCEQSGTVPLPVARDHPCEIHEPLQI